MNVLITGGGGFIGSHLVDSQLSQGNFVRAIDLHAGRLAHVTSHPNLQIIIGDITDGDLVRQSVERIDVIYHLASAHLDVSLEGAHYRRVNVDATIGLLEAAREAGVRRVVHCSSVGVIGDVSNPPADETSPCKPTNIYESTKLAGELAALAFAHDKDLPVVVARPAWVYGPRCPRTAKLFKAIQKGRFPIFGDGRNLRHPVYVSDAVSGLELCGEVDQISGQVYIIAGQGPVTIEELVRLVAEAVGVTPPKIHFPIFMGLLIAYSLQIAFKPLGRQPPASRRSLDFFLKNNAYAITRARRDLGFYPRVDLRSGLQKTRRWLVSGEASELVTEATAHG
ncbi:MAG TPA: NAD-dependent epimerase/dehydratase family protein [Anaerolineales bacterium]|jgi:nucleoside-diphosphate-sugar epimerase|nr:NAD-dependent epimerase/dehydratase family protein [Anaerolineales bacterium]